VIPESRRNAWRYHRVAAEDTLASVARTYRVQVAELAAANQLHESDSIQGVEALVVPVPPSAAPSAHLLLYTARRGDTLVTIADRFGVSLNQLRRWNKITGNKVAPGSRLHVAEPASLSRATSRGHRRKTTGTVAKAHEQAPSAGSSTSSAAHASAKKGGASAANKKQAPAPRASANARKRTAHKPAAHAKSSRKK
jgi:membrane-bound lytic murein transglycosylase D